jgi:hypothetical protein
MAGSSCCDELKTPEQISAEMCVNLQRAVNAWTELSTGKNAVWVEFGDERIKYESSNKEMLYDYIKMLQPVCNNPMAELIVKNGKARGGSLGFCFNGRGRCRSGC